MNLTLPQLRAVVAVAERQSFSRAAEDLILAQSSLSRSVAEVERVVGVTLLARTTRRVVLTADGEVFVRLAREVLDAYDAGMAHFAGHLEGTHGVLRIAALPSLAATLLPEAVIRLRRRRPGIRVDVEDVLAADVVTSVTSGRVDLALTAAGVSDTGPSGTIAGVPFEVPFEALAADAFHCLCAPGHPFASRDEVAWEELGREAFVAFDEASSVRRITDTVLASRDAVPLRRLTARNVATVAGLCAAGLGVSAVPALVLPLMEFAGLVSVPLVDPVVRRPVGVLTDRRRPPSPAAEGFVEVLRGMAAEGAPLPAGVGWTAPTRPAGA